MLNNQMKNNIHNKMKNNIHIKMKNNIHNKMKKKNEIIGCSDDQMMDKIYIKAK